MLLFVISAIESQKKKKKKKSRKKIVLWLKKQFEHKQFHSRMILVPGWFLSNLCESTLNRKCFSIHFRPMFQFAARVSGIHCRKSVRVGSFSGLHFPAIGLKSERLGALPYSIQMQENTNLGKSEYGHFSRDNYFITFITSVFYSRSLQNKRKH